MSSSNSSVSWKRSTKRSPGTLRQVGGGHDTQRRFSSEAGAAAAHTATASPVACGACPGTNPPHPPTLLCPPPHRLGGLKQQGAAHVKKRRWSMWRSSMGMSQKPRVASSMGVNLRRILHGVAR